MRTSRVFAETVTIIEDSMYITHRDPLMFTDPFTAISGNSLGKILGTPVVFLLVNYTITCSVALFRIWEELV